MRPGRPTTRAQFAYRAKIHATAIALIKEGYDMENEGKNARAWQEIANALGVDKQEIPGLKEIENALGANKNMVDFKVDVLTCACKNLWYDVTKGRPIDASELQIENACAQLFGAGDAIENISCVGDQKGGITFVHFESGIQLGIPVEL